MDLSYQEKSILGSLLAILVASGYYVAAVLRDGGQTNFNARVGRLIFIVVALVVIEVVYHIALALRSRAQPKDERDVLIEGKGYRTAYFSIFSGMTLVISWLLMVGLASDGTRGRVGVAPFPIVNVILLVLVVTELLKFFTQLFYYRRGLR